MHVSDWSQAYVVTARQVGKMSFLILCCSGLVPTMTQKLEEFSNREGGSEVRRPGLVCVHPRLVSFNPYPGTSFYPCHGSLSLKQQQAQD